MHESFYNKWSFDRNINVPKSHLWRSSLLVQNEGILALAEVRFSIVIVHRNGAQMLLNALAALMQAIGEADEIILVDNGSSDDSVEQARLAFPAVLTIENGCNNGFAKACNQGLARARGEFVLFLNNDAFLSPEALDRFVEDFADYPKAALIGGQLVGEDGTNQRSAGVAPTFLSEIGLIRLRYPKVANAEKPVVVETLVGACMAFRRSVADVAGRLDEDFFFYFEETEWCVRLRRKGWQVMVDPRIRIVHLKGASTRAIRRDAQIEIFRSRLLYYRKTMPAILALLLSVWRVLRLVINTTAHFAMVVLTMGQIRSLRNKLVIYSTQLAWLALGCPESWGLPDKCPAR
jgi:N-acetylglucosaminyl-diphospho-decaprenol L-rhamnosyltransferase